MDMIQDYRNGHDDQLRGANVATQSDRSSVEQQMQQLSQAMGGLTDDEHALSYGALHARQVGRSLDESCEPATAELSSVLGEFRSHHCAWCHAGLAEHQLDLEPGGLEVCCVRDAESRRDGAWLAGPIRTPVWRWLLAVVLWVGIPMATLGIFSWVMPTVAGFAHRRRKWMIWGAIWAADFVALLLLVNAVSPDQALPGLFMLGQWIAGMVYGLLQVKPWLAELPKPRRQRRAAAR